MNELYLDIGLPRTATTFRQQEIYPQLEGITYVCQPFRWNNAVNWKPTQKFLVADESLSNIRWDGWKKNFVSIDQSVKALYALFPHAKIIISYRNKRDWLRSIHNRYVYSGGRYDFDTWYGMIDHDLYDIDQYVDLVVDCFNKVLILDFKELKTDQDSYLKKLCYFLDVDIPVVKKGKMNASLGKNQMELLRHMNMFMWTNEGCGLPIQSFVKKALEKILED
jgi:sulfur relay (sulfurtransferase) DsrC/TusE family protein